MAIILPIYPVTKPSTLTGQTNGLLPKEKLSLIGVGNALMEYTAARAFRAMFSEARSNGFQIREVGDYRTFQEQLNLFLSRYYPVSKEVYYATSTAHRKYWPGAIGYGYSSVYWSKKLINGKYPATAAVPGTSNHGWGLALDIAEETDGDVGPEGITTRFVQWLVIRADNYGICAELQSEPWHWRYFTGDALPQAVLDYENSVAPPPIPTPPPPIPPQEITVQFQTMNLEKGSTGPEVKRVQEIIKTVGGQTVTVDGIYGDQTVWGVTNWQKFFGLSVDGKVGPQTWESLIEVWLKAA
jgi:hypothetical protein